MTTKLDAVKKSFVASALIVSQSLCLAPLSVLAADSSVRIAGQSIFTIPAGSGNMSADKRAEAVQNNLDNALVAAKDRSPASVNIIYAKGMPVVTMGGYQVITVDAASAKAAGTTPALLAKRWADAIRNSLRDQASLDSYIAQLSGNYAASAPPVVTNSNLGVEAGGYANQGAPPVVNAQYQGTANYGGYGGATQAQPQPQYQQQGGLRQGRVSYAPAGLVIPISLQTSISTQVAKPGDMIQANVAQTMYLGDSTIPAGSVVIGTITDAEAGKRLSRSGSLSVKFNRLRTPEGVETPISAHLIGGIAKYTDVGSDTSDTVRGEGWKAKVGQTAIRGAVGAGAGAALGTALGAIAARSGRGVGRGAWGGAAIGGGVGAASMLMRKGRDVVIPSGTQMQLQLDAPATVAGAGSTGGNL